MKDFEINNIKIGFNHYLSNLNDDKCEFWVDWVKSECTSYDDSLIEWMVLYIGQLLNYQMQRLIKDLEEDNRCSDYCGDNMDKAITTLKWLNERVKNLETQLILGE